ncbi:MAG: hypothetical protein HXS45_06720 [Theionarchaea archaeon]|nr:hypothetical protein [Theionarchaea archaeon]
MRSTWTEYQNVRTTDPLSLIHVLPPCYYILLLLSVFLCIYVIYARLDSRWLHLALLIQVSLLLWITPHVLSGAARDPDTLFHPGVSLHIESILNQEISQFDRYAEKYPGSFILMYFMMSVASRDISTFGTLVYPVTSCLIYILGWYTFTSTYVGKKAAFLSTLLAISSLHYVKLHPSPQSVGTMLVMVAMVLVVAKGKVQKIVGSFLFLLTPFIHPISPVLFLIFVASIISLEIVCRRGFLSRRNLLILVFIGLLFLGSVTAFSSLGETLARELSKVGALIFGTRNAALGIFGFAYSSLFILNFVVYFCIGLVVFFLLMNLIRNASIHSLCSEKRGLTLLVAAAFYALFGGFLGILENSPTLLERGLSFSVLMATAFIGYVVLSPGREISQSWRKISALHCTSFLLVFLAVTYPAIAYSTESYNSFPFSERAGMAFITRTGLVESRCVAMAYYNQLVIYDADSSSATFIPLHGSSILDFDHQQPDIFVYRKTGYYNAILRWDKSFEHNRYSEYEMILQSYNVIYISPSVRIFLRNEATME